MGWTLRWRSWSLNWYGSLTFGSGKISTFSRTALSIFLFSVNSRQPVRMYIIYLRFIMEVEDMLRSNSCFLFKENVISWILPGCCHNCVTVSSCLILIPFQACLSCSCAERDWPVASSGGSSLLLLLLKPVSPSAPLEAALLRGSVRALLRTVTSCQVTYNVDLNAQLLCR